MAHVDKIVLSSNAALVRKYGEAGAKTVRDAVDRLIVADRDKRGLITEYWAIDDTTTMERVGSITVPDDVSKRAAYKTAVDAIHREIAPDYLLILGAEDVIPYQALRNPQFDSNAKALAGFEQIMGDLAYACPGVASDLTASFVGPTTVVGRLPDILKGRDPAYLEALLRVPLNVVPQDADVYRDVFAVSAGVWQASTALSLTAAFGKSMQPHVSPAAGPPWTADHVRPRSHFINCHGRTIEPKYFGDAGDNVATVAQDSTHLLSFDLSGVIVAAECCFGAEIYKPNETRAMSIASAYLHRGAYAFFGSTTTSYGCEKTNDYADLICQFFFRHLLAGESTGSAALAARQDYVTQKASLDPLDHKTLAEFVLFGDPSIHPVIGSHVATPAPVLPIAPNNGGGAEIAAKDADVLRFDRAARRRRAMLIGRGLTGVAGVTTGGNVSRSTGAPARALEAVARALLLTKRRSRRFPIRQRAFFDGAFAFPSALALRQRTPDAVHVLEIASRERPHPDRVMRTTLVLGDEVDGEITNVRVVTTK